MTAWIDMVADKDASEELLEVLRFARTPHGTVDNMMRVHSLRPNTMMGHTLLRKAVLHDDENTLPDWFLETICWYVCMLNECAYSYETHWRSAIHLIDNDEKAEAIEVAFKNKKPELVFKGKSLAILRYAEKLTSRPGKIQHRDLVDMQEAGVDDAQILEANQVISYFNYLNRTMTGLGVTHKGEKSPLFEAPAEVPEA